MHQNKPTAPVTYTNSKGKHVLVAEDVGPFPIYLSLKELAVLQTGVNRSYYNCNCDLDKDALNNIRVMIDSALKAWDEDGLVFIRSR